MQESGVEIPFDITVRVVLLLPCIITSRRCWDATIKILPSGMHDVRLCMDLHLLALAAANGNH